jgi:dinuclear metal center YbgI/SA1388 family protein
MKIKEVIDIIEEKWPSFYAEDFDNTGLLVGDENENLKGILICHDSLESVVDEAISKDLNLIVSFHPIIFNGLKKITSNDYVQKSVVKAIKNDIAIYAIHTALDNSWDGVNDIILKKLGAKKTSILNQKANTLNKLNTYVPIENADQVRDAIFNAGGGMLGDYDNVSYNLNGEGTFRASENAKPFVGDIGKVHREKEVNIQVIFESHKKNKIISALLKAHPYEEVAYEIYPLNNSNDRIGLGMLGELNEEMDEMEFLHHLKKVLPTECIRYSNLLGKKIKKVAVLGGSGAFAIKSAIAKGADVFISGDMKYHDFYSANDKILLADIGHFESEQFTKSILFEYLSKKITKFAVALSEINTNPINYL